MYDIPSALSLFPLHSVLFPGARLPLKVFEPRYMDLAKTCIRDNAPFGICLIEKGEEVGAAAHPFDVGVSARIIDWEMEQLGVLQIAVQGERRFRILHAATGSNGLIRAMVEWLPPAPATPVPEQFADIVPLLEAVVADAGEGVIPPPHAFDDADWIGLRYAQILPIPLKAKQKLLELDDPVLRLSIIRQFLEQRGLLKVQA